MSTIEPSEDRVERVARVFAAGACGIKMRHEKKAWVNSHWPEFSDTARAALLADAPALIEARIAGMRSAANIIRDNGVRYSQDGTSLCPRPDGDQSGIVYAETIEADIAALKTPTRTQKSF